MTTTTTDTTAPITCTDAAVARLVELADREGGDMVLVIGARPGGCAGLQWEMYFDDVAGLDEHLIVTTQGSADATIRVAVDPTTATLAAGSTLDWRDGLDRSGFHIDNPAAQRTCGCGQSFS